MKNRIYQLRVDGDLKQREVAAALGITQRKYSYLETGAQELTEAFLIQLVEFYGTSVDYLLNLTDEPKPYPRKENRKSKG